MNSVTKVLLACAAVCIALYFVIAKFIVGTGDLKESLDLKSLAHTRVAESQAKPLKEEARLDAESPAPIDEVAPERDVEQGRIDARSVESKADEGATEEEEVNSAEALLKKTLGIGEASSTVRAVDVSYGQPPKCEVSSVSLVPVAVQYRFESPSIRGESLHELELLVNEYRRCDGGEFRFAHNPMGSEDATPLLKQMRLDELKYFFLQHRVPKAALRFPDDS